MAKQFLANSDGWLSWNHSTPTLYITGDDDEFDPETLRAWADEGFNVKYLPLGDAGKTYVNTILHLGDGMSIGERYAIVAFSEAASICLDIYSDHTPNTSKLCSLVAYYPTRIPDPQRRFSASFRVLVHLALGTSSPQSIGVTRRQEVLGIQGRRKTIEKNITPGIGMGGLESRIQYPVFSYEGVDPGFAEHDLEDYDAVADALAWSRSLSMVRRGFGAEVDLERAWEENVEHYYHTKDLDKLMDTFIPQPDPSEKYRPFPFVNYTPTMTGGVGTKELKRFYGEFFLRSSPPSFHMRLISRTIGVDRVVDELYVQFKHTEQMPWILPGIPPTNQKVEIVVVSIVGIRGGKIWHERIYWDQASVLFQVGLLDPDEIPDSLREAGLEMLPVSGSEAARKVMEVESEDTNDMLDDW